MLFFTLMAPLEGVAGGFQTMLAPFPARYRTYYLETSAWDAIQRRGGLDSDWGQLLGRATAARRLRIVAGVIVFEETLPIYKENPGVGDARLGIIERLADLDRTIALSNDIIHQHLIAILCGQAPPPPFTDRYKDLSTARRLLGENRSRIAELMAPNVTKDLDSLELLRESRQNIRAEMEKAGWPKITFAQFCGLEKSSFQSYIDHVFGPGARLPAEALRPLEGSRPLKMYRDGLLALMYLQTVRNRAPRASDLRDLHHAVAASVTDGLVTNDDTFKEWCELVAIPDFRVYQLADFLEIPEIKSHSP
jgi:hypothetical protein